ncbi:MAG: hypothetical protein JO352_01615 [Chloroflexi bacterium]|nr:hypothetical protein [Chloroflexota bacterium]MBV9599022.1 hypothetical protein [Chloroflexota bacterium]
MIFVVRTRDDVGAVHGEARVVHARKDPTREQRDLFCVGDEGLVQRLREDGCVVSALHDGWYPDELGGGVAVWGNGRYWEVRSSPFDVVDQG